MLNNHVTMQQKRGVCDATCHRRSASLSCMSRGWAQHRQHRAIRCQSASPRSSDVNDPSTGSCCGSSSSCCSSKSAPGITGGMAQPNLAFLKDSLVQAEMVTLSRQDMLTAFQDSQAMMSAADSGSEEKVVDITELLRGMPSDLVFTDDDWEEDEETSA